MYCPNCNAEIPEGSTFCGCCGQKVTQPEPQQYAAPAAPAYPGYSAYTSYSRPMNNMTKKEFLASDVGMSARGKAKLAVLVCLIAVVAIVAGIVATLSMSIFDIPVMSMALEVAGADEDLDVDELMDDLEDSIDLMEEDYEAIEDDLSKSERKDVEKWIDDANDLADSFSILNLRRFADSSAMIVAEYGEEFYDSDLENATEDMEVINQAMDAIVVFLVGFFFLPILFAVLGGTLKNTALTIVGIVFTAIAQIIFCGALWVVLSLAIGVVQAVLCSKVNTAYRDYRMGKLPA